MSRRMLIDASHPEQTRVVVVDGQRLLEFDTEIASQRTLKGNIYLAKVTRVEPSLQAAFVDYGGNRHGFLPFSEIHPDYYRLPVADREALKASEASRRPRADDPDDDDDIDVADQPDADDGDEDFAGDDRPLAADSGDVATYDDIAEAGADDGDGDSDSDETATADADDDADGRPAASDGNRNGNRRGRARRNSSNSEEDRRRGARMRRTYTIQEVIKRGQIMLVQVVKEERGTKGAAVTTYLSLAGRYCVLMPNTARGGGISRKITNAKDRSKLKETVDSLQIPQGMAVIVRTAGIGRTKTEIKRDFDFLAKSWERIRDLTLRSRAPALIYEESDLIKRTLRDTYSREIEEVLVQGDVAYREAKDFMKTLMPSHAKRVQPYKDASPPLFHRFHIDAQLQHLHSPIVQLRSGGYLVINLTEALVAIDINSGRSTRERHIEETALKTNLEAADEIARQLRLRDLAGLIVIDFIDMDDRRNNAQVERRLKDALRDDRARVQTGRISPLGLLELSRQRLRPSLLETMMEVCPVCSGLGRVPSPGSSALQVLAAIEDEGIRGRSNLIRVHLQSDVAFYILNEKRDDLARIERDYELRCTFAADSAMTVAEMRIEVIERREEPSPMDIEPPAVQAQPDPEPEAEAEAAETAEPSNRRRSPAQPTPTTDDAEDDDNAKRRRGRRGGRRRRREDDDTGSPEAPATTAAPAAPETATPTADGSDSEADGSERGRSNNNRRRRRRRSRKPAAPSIATFTRAATPLAFHVASADQPVAATGEASDRQDEPNRQAKSDLREQAAEDASPSPAADAVSPAPAGEGDVGFAETGAASPDAVSSDKASPEAAAADRDFPPHANGQDTAEGASPVANDGLAPDAGPLDPAPSEPTAPDVNATDVNATDVAATDVAATEARTPVAASTEAASTEETSPDAAAPEWANPEPTPPELTPNRASATLDAESDHTDAVTLSTGDPVAEAEPDEPQGTRADVDSASDTSTTGASAPNATAIGEAPAMTAGADANGAAEGATAVSSEEAATPDTPEASNRPRRRGWWQRLLE